MSETTQDVVDESEAEDAADEATTPVPSAEGDELILSITDAGLAKVLEIRDGEDNPDATGLRVMVVGTRGVEFDYDLSLEEISEMPEDSATYKVGDLTVIIPADSIDDMRGSTLDLPSNPMQGGLVIRNPNRPPVLSPDDIDLTGTLPRRSSNSSTSASTPLLPHMADSPVS